MSSMTILLIFFACLFFVVWHVSGLLYSVIDWIYSGISNIRNSKNNRSKHLIHSDLDMNLNRQYRSQRVDYIASGNHSFFEIESQIRELAKVAWSTEKAFRDPDFVIYTNIMANITSLEKILEIFLTHARRIAPGFTVPHMIPRVCIEPMQEFSAGAFTVDEEGWVKISVRPDFMSDKLAAKAILAHEVCHYILENSEIRKSNIQLNERYTDLCMFVLGFGEIFLSGYRRETAQHEYRPGHKLGYLTDDEYGFVQEYVMRLRQNRDAAPPGELEILKQRLLQLTSDLEVCQWTIETTRKKFPNKSELELYRYAVDRWEWERRRR